MNLLSARLRPAPRRCFAPSGVSATAPTPTTAWSATQALAPGVQLRLRLRPRRPVTGDGRAAGSACGWFESSRELSVGLEVSECHAQALPAAELGSGLEVFALA